jgi:hypothetical protein
MVCYLCSDSLNVCQHCGDKYIPDAECPCGNDRLIHNYNYKPRFKFYTKPSEPRDYRTQFLGLEFEVLCPDRVIRDRNVRRVYDNQWLYVVHDGSIGDFNFEAVTMPMTRKFFYEEAREAIGDQLNRWRASGCSSWESGTCGFHIHLSKNSFYSTHLFKLLKLWLQNPQFSIDLAQRTQDNWFDEYSSFQLYDNRTRDIVGRAKGNNPVRPTVRPRGGYPAGRYSAINTTSAKTVEWRLFKGSLRLPVVEKNIEAVLASYDYTFRTSLGSTNVPAFMGFVEANHSRYPNLYRFLRAIGYIGGERIPSILAEYRGD